MTFEDNFIRHSKEYFFSNDELLSNQREDIFKKINSNKFDKKNNESLKNLPLSDLTSFAYYYQPSKEEPTVKKIQQDSHDQFEELGYPSKKLENYYYLVLRLKQGRGSHQPFQLLLHDH